MTSDDSTPKGERPRPFGLGVPGCRDPQRQESRRAGEAGGGVSDTEPSPAGSRDDRRRARAGAVDLDDILHGLHDAAMAHAAARDATPSATPTSLVAAFRPHPTEDQDCFADRVAEVLASGASVLLVSDRHGTGAARRLAETLRASFAPERVAWVPCEGLDAVRAIAARPQVPLDVLAPDAFATALQSSLVRLREEAFSTPARGAARAATLGAPPDRGPWFGLGIVEEPHAEIRVHSPAGRTLHILEAPEGHGGPDTAGISPGDDVFWVHDRDPTDAAVRTVDAAFGASVLGGYASHAVARVVIDPVLFAPFSEALLARLARVENDDAYMPPEWALGADCSDALAAARRIGLDEGATLVYERRHGTAGRRERRAHGCVFTNVEPRMRLGGTIRALGGLALLRALGRRPR